jgi:hypothetical protein
VQKIGLRTYNSAHEAGHVEAASCEHGKTAMVSKYEELLIHGAHLKEILLFKYFRSISLISSFLMM